MGLTEHSYSKRVVDLHSTIMNLEELSKSMRELESELASYEHGIILFRHDIRNYSTPRTEQMSGVSTSCSPRETGYERDRALAQKRATSPPILTREGASDDTH